MSDACPTCHRPLPEQAGLEVDLSTNSVIIDGRVIMLGPRQAEILSLLKAKMPGVVRKNAILTAVWSFDGADDDLLKALMHYLRRKLAGTRARIIGHWGVGYQLRLATDEAAPHLMRRPLRVDGARAMRAKPSMEIARL